LFRTEGRLHKKKKSSIKILMVFNNLLLGVL